LENTVDGEAIRSLIHAIVVLSLDETALFSSSNGAVFFWFYRLNAPITYVILAVDGLAHVHPRILFP
jgi:hypothetical protein